MNTLTELKEMRGFGTGATRSSDKGKLDYEGCLSPIVLKRYTEYIMKHCIQADGKERASDNWQKGMPKESYIKGLWRHFMDLWLHHRDSGQEATHDIETALCAILFNAQGYLYELLREQMESPDEA